MLDAAMTGEMSLGDAAVDVLIVGSGFAGMAMVIKLRQAGFDDVLMIEKGHDVGGTWRDNVYPGCACDIPSHLYSLSFEPKTDWSRMYPQQPEIYEYLRGVAQRHDMRARTRFNTAFVDAAWDEGLARWRVSTSTGVIMARVLVSGMGGLHIPAFPKLKGLENFAGKTFHSAQWDHDYKLAGKKVAVVGTGASAIQFVPQIAPDVARLDLYQRTPPWIIPKPDRAFSNRQKSWFKFGAYRRAFRAFLFYVHELRVLGFLGNKRAQKLAAYMALSHIKKRIPDPVLRAKVTPNYKVGCKRVMISNDYYPALTRPNVDLITDGIAEVKAHSIVDVNGVERAVDAIIFGTGFEVTTAYKHWNIKGLGGQDLRALWDAQGMRAFRGVAVSGFPNFFMLLGPHTALGHNSVVIMIEAQVNYIVDALNKLRASAGGALNGALNVAQVAQDEFIAGLKQRLRGTVWQDGGCESWYKDEHGFVSTIWPGSAASYQKAMSQADLRDFRLLATQGAKLTA